MRIGTQEIFGEVKIAQLGESDVVTVKLTKEDMTVAEVFTEAGIEMGENVYCSSIKAEPTMIVDDGDVLQILKEKVEAGK